MKEEADQHPRHAITDFGPTSGPVPVCDESSSILTTTELVLPAIYLALTMISEAHAPGSAQFHVNQTVFHHVRLAQEALLGQKLDDSF